jgi:hypothetical protein
MAKNSPSISKFGPRKVISLQIFAQMKCWGWRTGISGGMTQCTWKKQATKRWGRG